MADVRNIVVDSSVIVKWLNAQDEKYLDKADNILKLSEEGEIEIFAPELSKYEVGNAILFKGMSPSKTRIALSTLYSLPIKFISLTSEDCDMVLEIAYDGNITYYDAVFVELAEKIGGNLVTDNPKHQMAKKNTVVALRDWK